MLRVYAFIPNFRMNIFILRKSTHRNYGSYCVMSLLCTVYIFPDTSQLSTINIALTVFAKKGNGDNYDFSNPEREKEIMREKMSIFLQ